MSDLPQIDIEYLSSSLIELLNTPSPTGFTEKAIDQVAQFLTDFPFISSTLTRKGALIASCLGVAILPWKLWGLAQATKS